MEHHDALAAHDVEIYRKVLRQPGIKRVEVAAELKLAAVELAASVARLASMGVLHADAGEKLTAISPMLAEATVLGAEDLELASRRANLESRRDVIRQLVPDWNAAVGSARQATAVDLITDPAQISNALMHYSDQCRDELITIAPGQSPDSRIDDRIRLASLLLLQRGVQLRSLFHTSAVCNPAARRYLKDAADRGAEIRIAGAALGRCVVIDRNIALLPMPGDGPQMPALAIVREVNVVTWLLTSFEGLWESGTPFDEAAAQAEARIEMDETRAAILQLLADGEKDEAIARKLEISVRTCRRHIAEYMARVGASSRFQAGVIAARAGYFTKN